MNDFESQQDGQLDTNNAELDMSTPTLRRRILLVAGYFPPFAPSGATRAPSLARHWTEAGHEVKVLAARNPGKPNLLQHNLPQDAVVFAPFPELKRFSDVATYLLTHRIPPLAQEAPLAEAASKEAATKGGAADFLPFRRYLADLYRDMLFIPDKHLFWVETGVETGMQMIKQWQPDLIYSTGPPHSGHMIASRLAAASKARWVAELRDIWANNPYGLQNRLRSLIESRLEKRVLANADALVAVTATTRDDLEQLHSKPTVLCMNGYDPEDFLGLEEVQPLDDQKVTIIHAGSIYIGRRDPSSLFEAVSRLGPLADQVRMLFYGDQADSLMALAQRKGVEKHVEVSGPVSRQQVLELERRADVLLLCRWDDPSEDSIIPGKLFEYIGARRPMLAIGSETGEAADIIRRGNFGLVTNDPDKIVQNLKHWIDQKKKFARLPDINAGDPAQFTRKGQFQLLDQFFNHHFLWA